MSQIHSKEKTLFKRLLRLVFLSNNFLFLLQSYHFLTYYFFFLKLKTLNLILKFLNSLLLEMQSSSQFEHLARTSLYQSMLVIV